MDPRQSLGEQLYDAAKWGNFDDVKRIVSAQKLNPDFNINYQNDQGNTALYIACAWGFQSTNYLPSAFYEIAKYLIEHSADINLANKENKTPLYIAASWGHPHVVHLLILHGANLNVQVPTDQNCTPLQIAAFSKRSEPYMRYEPISKHHAYYVAEDYMKQIKKTGEYLKLFPEIEEDYKVLIAYPAVNPKENIPKNIMDIIVKYNHFAVVKELVHAGADINIQDTNGKTALDNAIYWKHLAMQKLLRENGAALGVSADNAQKIKVEISQSATQ